jgi:hypothetical protein
MIKSDDKPVVIPWEKSSDVWRVACRRKNGRRVTYPVGSKSAAAAEANRIADGGEPRTTDEQFELRK